MYCYFYRNKNDGSFLSLEKQLTTSNYPDWTIETIAQYEVISEEEFAGVSSKQRRIDELKRLLASSDYLAIKRSEGLISDEEYEPIKLQRQEWRKQINELE
mgnify:CR=1 FL=1